MIIQENISLAQYTTFHIGGNARFFCIVKNDEEVVQAVKFAKGKNIPFFVLGGGSNILVSDEGFQGLVIKMENKGYRVIGLQGHSKSQDHSTTLQPYNPGTLLVSAGAGEIWDSFVEWTLENGWNGLENLSSIPGTVGACAVQNIGAYGAEAGQCISNVHAFDTKEMKFVDLSGKDCHFGYRNSLFKYEKGRYIITRVDFSLKKDDVVNIEYKDLKEYFEKTIYDLRFTILEESQKEGSDLKSQISNLKSSTEPHTLHPTPLLVRDAVISIRSAKLPDWKKWGTAGSFFKNPVISAKRFAELKIKYPELPGFPDKDSSSMHTGNIKIQLGWILDHICHAKGIIKGNVGTYEKQALVIIAKPGATSKEIVDLTKDLMKQVYDATGIAIESEVEWVN